MYQEYFKLNNLPFENSPDPEFFFMGYRYREILALMIHGVVSRKGLICISGPIGSGKTTLATVLTGYLPADAIVINMTHPKASPGEMRTYLARQLGVVEFPDTPLLQTETIRQELIKFDNADRHCVLIIDESQYMSDALMQEIVVLTNLETPQRKLIQILMLGQKEFIAKLNRPELRQLKHRIFVTRTLTAMDAEQTFQYISYRLQIADGDPDIFSEDALEQIFKYSGGIPRLINRLCDAALLGAFTSRKQGVEEEDVRNANIDLGMELDTRVSAYNRTSRRPRMHRPAMSASEKLAVPSSPVASAETGVSLEKGQTRKTAPTATTSVTERSSDKMPSFRNRKRIYNSKRPEHRNLRLQLILFLLVITALVVGIILSLRGKNLKSVLISEIKRDKPEENARPTGSLTFSPVPKWNPETKNVDHPANAKPHFALKPQLTERNSTVTQTASLLSRDNVELSKNNHPSGKNTPATHLGTASDASNTGSSAKKKATYPYSVFLDTLATHPKAVIALARLKKRGLSPYWVKVKQGGSDVRFNIFTGYFESAEQAALAIQKQQPNDADNAIVMKTPYAVLIISDDSSSYILKARQQSLEKAGYAPYRIPGEHPNQTHLYVGAFYTFQDAANKCSELIDSGIRCEAVTR